MIPEYELCDPILRNTQQSLTLFELSQSSILFTRFKKLIDRAIDIKLLPLGSKQNIHLIVLKEEI